MINICYDEFNNIINKLKNFDSKIKSIVWNLISLIIKRNELNFMDIIKEIIVRIILCQYFNFNKCIYLDKINKE